jgi:hypothetical protein
VSDHDGDPRLDDPCLLGRNFRQRPSQVLLMIEPDRRDGGSHRFDHVRGVEPPAQADLTDRNLRAGAAEELECDRRRDLEERRLHPQPATTAEEVDNLANVAHGRVERLGGDGPSVDDEALREIDEMRRRVTGRTVARRAKGGIHHRRDRSLAVGPGDVHRSERAFRTAERVEDGRDVVEAELDAELLQPEQPGERVGQRGGVRQSELFCQRRS